MKMQRIFLLAGLLILIGAGVAFLISYLRGRTTDTNQSVNITVDTEAIINAQRVVQQGNQEGDAAFYASHVSDLTLGRVGREQPTTDDSGKVVYRAGDQITYNLVTPDTITGPYKVRYEVLDGTETRVATGDPLDINPGANSACCILVPEKTGPYILRWYSDDTLFAARYFVVRE